MTQPSPKRAEILQCPHCGNDVGVTLDVSAFEMPCPHCGQAMVIPSIDGSTEIETPFVIDDEPADRDAEAEARMRRDAEGRLNSLRIQAITAERRAINRSRAFSTAGGVAMLIVIAHCVLEIGDDVSSVGWTRSATALSVVSVIAALVAIRLFHRARRLAAQSRRSLLEDPDTPPDFTPLQDGSQRWRNLEQVEE